MRGIDDEGDTITSLVVDPVDGPATKVPAGPKLTKGAQIALRALNEAIAEVGAAAPASNHIPAAAKVVTIEQWWSYADRIGISASELADSRRKAFNRAHEALVAARKVGVWNPYAWIA